MINIKEEIDKDYIKEKRIKIILYTKIDNFILKKLIKTIIQEKLDRDEK